jgi:hypothetical protein
MKQVSLSRKLVVVADESGKIVSAMWPGIRSSDGPTETGVVVPDNYTSHEVAIPQELFDAARPDLSSYALRAGKLVKAENAAAADGPEKKARPKKR